MESLPNNITRNVTESTQRALDDLQRNINRSPDLLGKTMDAATGLIVSMTRESVRLLLKGSIGIAKTVVGKPLKLAGQYAAIGAKAALKSIPLPFPSLPTPKDVSSRMDAGANFTNAIHPLPSARAEGVGPGKNTRNPDDQPEPGRRAA